MACPAIAAVDDLGGANHATGCNNRIGMLTIPLGLECDRSHWCVRFEKEAFFMLRKHLSEDASDQSVGPKRSSAITDGSRCVSKVVFLHVCRVSALDQLRWWSLNSHFQPPC